MIPADKADLFAAVNAHRQSKDKPALTSVAAQEWWDTLRELTLSECLRALRQHAKTGRFCAQPNDVYKLVTGREDGGQISKGIDCTHIENGVQCTERWIFGNQGHPLCREHYRQLHNLPMLPELPHRWQDLIGAFRALEKIGESRARGTYGDECVDYVLAHHDEVLELMPDKSKAPTRPLPIPRRAA